MPLPLSLHDSSLLSSLLSSPSSYSLSFSQPLPFQPLSLSSPLSSSLPLSLLYPSSSNCLSITTPLTIYNLPIDYR